MNRSSRMAVKQKQHAHPQDAGGKAMTADMDDYEAIEKAVMATARGRWFLSEYLRRHQNDETRRLVQALRKLTRVAGGEEVARYRAVLEQERAALDGIRLLLAQAADRLAKLTTPDSESAPEPTLPEAAASRLSELLRAAAPRREKTPAIMQELTGLFDDLARLLGEACAVAEPLPDKGDIMPASQGAQAAAPAVTGNATQAERKAGRIVIRRHEHSEKVDIPLPEREARGTSRRAASNEAPQNRQARGTVVRIRRAVRDSKKDDGAGVADKPHSSDKMDRHDTSTLADEAVSTE